MEGEWKVDRYREAHMTLNLVVMKCPRRQNLSYSSNDHFGAARGSTGADSTSADISSLASDLLSRSAGLFPVQLAIITYYDKSETYIDEQTAAV